MLSTLELRHVIESAFLPTRCCCRVESLGYLQIEIYDSESGSRKLLVTGISQSELVGNQEITKLIEEVRAELHVTRQMRFDASVDKEASDQKNRTAGLIG
ncbi:DUF1652 domain-containing protein [Pseudomonas sp. NPDC096917]|uniref:DUF1652 domain-containing protein n=1 Tax=Pseudomonas sp. NPDC096917 TaxID=3364483 RepID=UPI00383B1BE3